MAKPDGAPAETRWREGCVGNSGIFVWRVGDFLDEIRRHTPEIAPALAAHPSDAAAFFNAVKPVSVDVGVLESSARVMVMAGDFGWDDVGKWGLLGRGRAVDGARTAARRGVYG